MQRLVVLAASATLLIGVPAAAAGEILHQAKWRTVDLDYALPDDLTHPEGKTRWELSTVVPSDSWMRTIHEINGGALSVRDTRNPFPGPVHYSPAARDWWMPHRATAPLSEPLQFSEIGERRADELWVRTQALGSGWVFLPSGPREAKLQRSLVIRSTGGKGGFRPDRLVYRWIDPRAGAVAEVWGRPSADGRSIVEIEGAATIESVLQGGLPLKIFRDEIEISPFQRLALGFDRMGTCVVGLNSCVKNADCTGGAGDKCTIPISEVTTIPHATMGDLIAASSWDFTPTQLADSRFEIGSTTAPINAAETCNNGQCGFATSLQMGREDKNFVDPLNAFITLSATEGEQRAGDYTIWLRAGVRHEGIATGGLGESETRFCYVGTDVNGDTRPDVPLWRFAHQDMPGAEWYMQTGDAWANTPFNCEQSIFNHVCPNSCGFFCEIWIKGCDDLPGVGQQGSVVIKEGPVTLPSGHTMNALLIRQVVDFCVYLSNACLAEADRVHQVIYLWVVPNIGTVARLMSEQRESSDTTFTDLSETDIKYGLFPPRSISSTSATDTTISISWDPGTVTHHIDGYKIYWDTDSGATTAYAFDSVTNSLQINVSGTSATISGLTAGTDYYITVTTLSDYIDIASGVMTTYESLLLPATTSGAAGPLPPELVAGTIGGVCTPATEVTGVTVTKSGSNIEMCWAASADTCVDGYTILGATSREPAGNFSPVVPDTGLVTCHTFDPSETYFIVVGKGTGGTGPWGHFGM